MSAPSSPLLRLFLTERNRLVRLIGRIVGCRDTAEDLAQDAFMRLWGRPLGDEDRNLLYRTGQNLALDHLRARRVRADYAGAVTIEQMTTRPVPPDHGTAARQDLGSLMDALKTLPERSQRAFLLNRLDGLSYAEIAQTLGVSVSTVEKDIIRALQTCRQWRDRREREERA